MTEMLTEAEAAKALGISRITLGGWRRAGTGPRYSQLGPRSIRYSRADLDAFIAAKRMDANPQIAPATQLAENR